MNFENILFFNILQLNFELYVICLIPFNISL